MEMFLTIKLCTELFSIEQIISIKMDLALHNLQRLIWHKTQQTKPNLIIYYDKFKTSSLVINNDSRLPSIGVLQKKKKQTLYINLVSLVSLF